jgi:putative ABC transport system permease protein
VNAHRPRPPRIAEWLVAHLLPEDDREFVLGDLEEGFGAVARQRSLAAAKRWYWVAAASALAAMRSSASQSHALYVEPARKGDTLMKTLTQDVRYGLRVLGNRPGFTAVAVLTLALGIGATSAIFTVAHTLLLESLPFPEPERLTTVLESNPGRGWPRFSVSPANFLDWRSTNESFTGLAAWGSTTMNYRGSEAPERLRALSATEGFLEMLGGTPALGRGFSSQEFESGREQVVILAHGFWVRAFGSRPDVLGETITLNGLPYDIVGVMHPRWTFGGRDIALFVPRAFTASQQQARGAHYLSVLGQLKPGILPADAQAEMTALAAKLEQRYPDTNTGWGIVVTPLHESIVGSIRPMVLLLLGAVATVLLIACANVANMLLARATVRAREMAIRRAIGANTARIVRQLLTESVLMATAGGALGLLLAHFGLKALLGTYPTLLPRSADIGVDATVLAFTTALAMLAAIVFGLAPSLAAARGGLAESLKEGGRGDEGGRSRRLMRGALVVAEVALALVLLAGAGLLLKSYARLASVEPGFITSQRLSVTTILPRPKYAEPERMIGFYREAAERLGTLPGVQRVALASMVPVGGSDELYSIDFEGRPPLPPGQGFSAIYYLVSPNYFEVMGIAVLRGRGFTDRDRDGTTRVAIINDEFARLHYPDQDPVGQRIRIGRNSSIVREIVGVVASVKHYGLNDPSAAQVYEPFEQMPNTAMNFVLATSVEPGTLSGSVRRQIQAVDPEQPVAAVTTFEQMLADSVEQPRVQMTLLGLFAAVAVLLAAAGLYGVMSYIVAQRTREIGIRMALGARAGSVLRIVMGQALGLAGSGLVIGGAAALLLARVLSSTLEPMLFQVSPADSTILSGVAVLLLCVSLLAALVPALRAVRVDPIRALRSE